MRSALSPTRLRQKWSPRYSVNAGKSLVAGAPPVLGYDDIVDVLDLSSARRVNQGQKRININFPAWVVGSLGLEAADQPLNADAASGIH